MSKAIPNVILKAIPRENETQVFRTSPIAGKYYETAELTRTEGEWPNNLHFTTNKMRYVGKFVQHLQFGYGEGATHIDIFDDNGIEVKVYYSYEGNTSFREVAEREHGQFIPLCCSKPELETCAMNPMCRQT